MRVDHDALYAVLAGDDHHRGVFEEILGFGTSTGVIKGVHVMNDLAQAALGGAPDHHGDLVCKVIREHKLGDGEDNRDDALRSDARFGANYARAFPPSLGRAQVSRLRGAAEALLNFDGGLYRAGQRMASGLATNKALLGAEGFRRFGVGRYIHRVLGPEGKRRLIDLFEDEADPISRGLAPIRLATTILPEAPEAEGAPRTPFDEALGQRITTLLTHRLTKTTLLRFVLVLATLGVTLKVLGAGRPGGRPRALATAVDDNGGPRPARQESVQAFARGVSTFYDVVASRLASHPLAGAILVAGTPSGKRGWSEAPAETLPEAAAQIVQQARTGALKGLDLYPPEQFAVALGRKAGVILPRRDQAGWGRHLALTTDAVEALVLSGVPSGGAPVAWRDLWLSVREDLGLTIGAGDYEDAQFLAEGGVLHVDLDALARNSEAVLSQAVRRGVARRLPDSGAEAGGGVQ